MQIRSFSSLMESYERLIARPNPANDHFYNGLYTRYRYPVLTREHIPPFWMYDADPASNPFMMQRLGVNATMNSGAIKLNGKYCLVVRVEGMDRKSFFAVAESDKPTEGFRCVKLKIGAIDFDRELSLLKHIRTHFSAKEIELRVDANGAFTPPEAMDKLKRLAEMDLHSIEQPIRAGQLEEMAHLAAESPLPIALDEELIGCNAPDEKRRLLETIHPQYIILKPSLHGGISGCTEWIHLAEAILGSTPEQPKWWVTSALESQIGLNAIAQWCATLGNPLPQGLGTGEIFKDDKHRLIQRKGDTIWFTNDL